MFFQMQANTYLINADGTYSPKNVTATNVIRCIQCNQLFPPGELEGHMNSHLTSHNLLYSNQQERPSKVSFANFTHNPEDDNVSVHSVRDEDLPQQEHQRRIIQACQSESEEIAPLLIHPCEITLNSDRSFSNDELASTQEQLPDNEKPLVLSKKVNLPSSQHYVERSRIILFEHQREEKAYCDTKKLKSKKKHENSLEIIGFQIIKMTFETPSIEKQRKKNNVQLVDIGASTRKPKLGHKISTVATAKTNKKESILRQSNSDFQCPSCHGFYCSTCKSTIPPFGRPAPPNFKPDKTRISDFYKKNFNCDNCRSVSVH